MGQVGTGWTGTVGSPYCVGQVGLGQGVLQISSPPKWRKYKSFRGNGLRSWRPERAMDRMDLPRTSIDERMLSGRRAVVIV